MFEQFWCFQIHFGYDLFTPAEIAPDILYITYSSETDYCGAAAHQSFIPALLGSDCKIRRSINAKEF